nr:uncharacterized protein LOC125422653 [Ziziphus jujuba var. spinosa]
MRGINLTHLETGSLLSHRALFEASLAAPFEASSILHHHPLRSIVDLASPSPSKHLAGGRSLILEANYPSKHFWPVNTKVRFKEELPPLEEEVGPNEEYADSAAGFDGSSNTSGSLYAEKHDTSSSHEIESLKSTTSGDL